MSTAWRSVLAYSLCTVPLSLLALFAKWQWMRLDGYRIYARSVGAEGDAALGTLIRLSFLRADLLLTVALAGGAMLAARLLAPRWRPTILVALCGLLALLLFVQTRALSTVGTFMHVELARSALRFVREQPQYLRTYLSLGGLVKLVGVLVLTVLGGAWAARRDGQRREGAGPGRSTLAGLGAGAAVLLAASLAGWLAGATSSPFHRAYLIQALTGYVSRLGVGSPHYARLTPGELRARYRRELAGVPPSPKDRRWWGRQPDADVLVLVLETVPARCLDLAGDLQRYPTLARLRRRAFVATRHYTTYPYSSLANFSFMTSWYPPRFARAYVNQFADARIPSLLWRLRNRGYHTALYEPFRARFEDDPLMYRIIGFERQVIPGHLADNARPAWDHIVRADSLALRELRADLASWFGANRRYVAVLMPQVSHAPWVDITGGRAASRLERCRALVEIADGWLGTLVADLERAGRLERTLIVVTSDHGIRTAEEDPEFMPGRLDDYSFRVPLLIHAPAALDSTLTIGAVTSAIDVGTTLLDLLGLERTRDRVQGNALWDPALSRRTMFLFAQQYFGANGFRKDGAFHAWNAVSNSVWRAPDTALRFTDAHLLRWDSPAADSIVRFLNDAVGFQRAWLSVMPRAADSLP